MWRDSGSLCAVTIARARGEEPTTPHGVVLTSGVVQDGDVLRGLLDGRGGLGSNFDHYFPGTEPSGVNGLALTVYDQAIVVGERTLGGERQTRAARVHQ